MFELREYLNLKHSLKINICLFMGTYYELCVKDMSTILPAEEYIRRFRDAETFMRRCMECRNYNRTWGCPPYDHDIEEELGHYNSVMITVTVINLGGNRIFLTEWDSVTAPQRERLEKMLLEKEKELGGKAFGFGGTCRHCPAGKCTRRDGLPCRHPELVRPSLEAYGFDISKTLAELFDIELVWGKEGFMPEYITLVSGCMFDKNIQ